MENKNVLLAVILSTAILIGWSFYFENPEEAQRKRAEIQGKTETQTNIQKPEAPQPSKANPAKSISRNEALKESDRVLIENKNLSGSISLRGALIDDIILKNYRETLDPNSKPIVLLSPKKYEQGYFVESGWATTKSDIKVPDNNSLWQIKEGKKLTPNSPITLEWNSREGLIFSKKIEIDDKYLFKITETVRNDKNRAVDLFHYGQITKNAKPTTENFYILHEGLIGVVDKNLKEETYSAVEKEKKTYNGKSGWFGITDKYWMSAIIPESGKSFKGEYSFTNNYKANFIISEPNTISPQKSAAGNIKIFIGAKEVYPIDSYAEKEKIDRFDLAIDWGWFYFITKPLFFVIDYIFKVVGNFGVAIIILTALVRSVFFPLSNYSFKSMAKMKVLQPEMLRIKELYKDDVRRTQQEIMALYKREKVNPLSGCLPILVQIPIFFAVYKMLFVTLEMRHAPFFGWIKDLSAADPTTIFNLFGLIPWEPPTFLMIGIWPILMGITMYLQQKLNPAPPDPIQAKIFAWFPFIITIMLASFPSGLVIYWTASNILTMAQQYYIMRKTTVKTV
ncbi:membrane protein insertase YidC [Candidatus Fonsibacter ubiquis]|uniref:membrane protein insertase YidC n=1 Tax=Candidatus Fonsibacter ubiquis TaxID=1925548 RepID=UPI000C07B4AA|nr:membrane protein insertase YidC [Candidatus Fonsibacter ubiquis]